MEDLKKEVKKIVEITKECPENLQLACFEILLRDFLESRKYDEGKNKELHRTVTKVSKESPSEDKGSITPKAATGQGSDLTATELHVKARKFMEKYNITIEHLNQLFYKEDDKILSLFDDLKTTRTSESQIRVALLKALVNALSTGEFEANVEDIRSECQDRKCYDKNNFGGNFQNNASLFDFDKYKKGLKTIRLSEAGKKELSELIEELQ